MDSTNILDGSSKWPKRFGRMPGMPDAAACEADLRTLRLRYNAAYSGYQSCLLALNSAALTAQPPSKDLLERESKALRELNEARGELIGAMAAFARVR